MSEMTAAQLELAKLCNLLGFVVKSELTLAGHADDGYIVILARNCATGGSNQSMCSNVSSGKELAAILRYLADELVGGHATDLTQGFRGASRGEETA